MTVLQLQRHGSTAVLTMNRPAQRNALDSGLRDAFASAIPQVRDDPAIRAVVITGAGGHFCAGGDIKGMSGSASADADVFEGRERMRTIHRWLDGLVDLEKPVIAAVEGAAFGAGLSVMLAADFVMASPNATFCTAFARMGYIPDMGMMYTLPRAVGLAHAKELVFSARTVDAQEAVSLGLVHQIAQDNLLAQALSLAARFQDAPVDALGIAKSIMNHAFESERRTVFAQEASAQALCRQSDFHRDAVRRFLAKDAPRYRWPQP